MKETMIEKVYQTVEVDGPLQPKISERRVEKEMVRQRTFNLDHDNSATLRNLF